MMPTGLQRKIFGLKDLFCSLFALFLHTALLEISTNFRLMYLYTKNTCSSSFAVCKMCLDVDISVNTHTHTHTPLKAQRKGVTFFSP